jgi:hypothetical protein
MAQLHSFTFILHIIFGSIALVLFWVPIFTKKGQLNHRKFGQYYKNAMYAVALTGVIMAMLVLGAPLTIKHEYANHQHAGEIAETFRYFSMFLLYLALLNFTATRHGIEVLRIKDARNALRRFNYIIPIWALTLGGTGIFAMGLLRENTLFMIFGIFGSIIGGLMLRYCLRQNVPKNTWILEHIGSMIGSGIGAYTAFLAFGGRTLFSELGQWQMVFWIAPGVIGATASYLFCKRYEKVFKINARAVSTNVANN